MTSARHLRLLYTFLQKGFLPACKLIIYLALFADRKRYEALRSRIPHLFARFGLYERHNLDLLKRFVAPGDTVCDIGASYGVYTKALSREVGPTGRVLAFEPLHAVREGLRLFCSDLTNVEISDQAISDRVGALQLHVPTLFGMVPESLFSSLEPQNGTIDSFLVPCSTLDAMKENLARLTFIKVDIENHEQHFFRGAIEVIRTCRPVIQFEENSHIHLKNVWPSLAASVDYSLATAHFGQLTPLPDVSFDQLIERNFYLIPNERMAELCAPSKSAT